jgi:hypothetical protein
MISDRQAPSPVIGSHGCWEASASVSRKVLDLIPLITSTGLMDANLPSPRLNRYEFQLRISSEEYLDYYRGIARHVIVRCTSGQTVQFPAALLRRFVVDEGVHGAFVLLCDANNKCIELQRVS